MTDKRQCLGVTRKGKDGEPGVRCKVMIPKTSGRWLCGNCRARTERVRCLIDQGRGQTTWKPKPDDEP